MVGHIWMCMYVKVGGDHSQSIYHNRRLLKTQCLFLQLVVLHVYGNQPKLFWVRMLWILSALLVPAAKVWEGYAYCCDHGYIAMSLTLALALITVRAGRGPGGGGGGGVGGKDNSVWMHFRPCNEVCNAQVMSVMYVESTTVYDSVR